MFTIDTGNIYTDDTRKKKRELNCSPPQGNCWSGAFAKYLRSTSSLTSKLWLGEETVSSVGLSPNCGLVNSEGGTWARTPGRYQLLDHGGTGGRGGLWRWRHWETHMYSYNSSALFSLSLLLIITSSINSTDSGSVTLLVTISCIRRWFNRKKTNKQTITLTRQNTYRIRGELQRAELNRGLKNLQHDQKQSLLCQCWHVLLHFLLILFHSQIPLPKLQ